MTYVFVGSAVVNIYSEDGTVLVFHGGVEMGQGLNTKMMQIAALELNIPMEMIRIPTNSTEKVHTDTQTHTNPFPAYCVQIANAPNTGASTGADLNGGAVKDACVKLHQNLKAFLNNEADNLTDKSESEVQLLQHWKKNGSWYKPGDNGYNLWSEVCYTHTNVL